MSDVHTPHVSLSVSNNGLGIKKNGRCFFFKLKTRYGKGCLALVIMRSYCGGQLYENFMKNKFKAREEIKPVHIRQYTYSSLCGMSSRFTDPLFWTEYFPPYVMKDLNALGASVSPVIRFYFLS